MRRVFWISVGVGVTIYVLQKVNKANAVASQFTPSGISAAVNNLADSVRTFSAEFRTSMVEHEQSLTDTLLSDEPPSSGARRERRREPDWNEFGSDEGDPEEYF